MPLTEIWSRTAALTACCNIVRACVPELPADSVYQGDLDVLRTRPSCRVYQVSEPVERGWTDERSLSKQAQAWLLTILTAQVGEEYSATVLGSDAAYTAILGDTKTTIRGALLAEVLGLGKPIAASAVSTTQMRIVGDDPGQHLGIVTSANIGRALEADNLHQQGLMPSFWTARFEFEEQPGVAWSESRAPAWSTRLRGYLQMGLADQLLRAAHLDFNEIVLRTNITRADRGKTTVVEVLDVQFSAIQGLGHDVPSIESFGTAPAVEVSNAP